MYVNTIRDYVPFISSLGYDYHYYGAINTKIPITHEYYAFPYAPKIPNLNKPRILIIQTVIFSVASLIARTYILIFN